MTTKETMRVNRNPSVRSAMRTLRASRWPLACLAMLALAACGGGGGGGAPPVAPAPPTIGQLSPADRAITVAFTPPAVTGGASITQFTAFCRAGTQDPVTATGAASPITVGGLVNGREYACTVTARNSAGESPPSTSATATPFTTPAAPVLSSLSALDGALEAAFSAPADNGGNAIIDYRLACTAAGSTRSVSGAGSPLRLTGLANGTAHSCVVSARNTAGEGAASGAQIATPRTLPGAPVISAVTADLEGLIVAFSPPASDGGAAITRYTVQCTGGGASRVVSTAGSPVFLGGLVNGVTYSCGVRAANVAGEGPLSATQEGTPRDFALEAQLSSAVDQGSRRATLSWRDTFPAGTAYRVDAAVAGGAFVTRATVNGSGSSGSTLSWTTEVSEPLTLRVVAVRDNRPDAVLRTAQAATSVVVAVVSTTNPPTITLSSSEPVSGAVTLSISGGVSYPLVEWFINLNRVAVITPIGGPGNPFEWNTSLLANGDYLVVARVQTATNTFTELRRTVRVVNFNLSVGALTFGGSATVGGGLFLVARASSAAGIGSVEARIEGVSLGVLAVPNCPECTLDSFPAAETYRWRIDTTRFPSGNYAVVVTAITRDGLRRSVDYTLQVRNPPVVTLTTPGDYDIVFDRLAVRGTVSSDRPGGVRTTVTLGSFTVVDSSASSFEGSLDLSGLPGGTYRLTVRAVDSAGVSQNFTRQIIVTTSRDRQYSPVLSLGDDVTLIESDGVQLLYVGSDGRYRLQTLSGGAPVVLAGAESINSVTGWSIDGGRVVAQGRGSDCSTVCIYEWDANGTRRNLSASNPHSIVGSTRCSDQSLVSRGNFVMWANWLCGSGGTITVFDRTSNSFRKIDPPPGATFIGNTQFDITSDGSAAFIWAQMGGSGMSSTFDVFRVSGSSSTRLSVPGVRSVYPRTRGTRVVWEQSPIGGNSDNTVELISLPLAGGSSRSIATRVNQWVLTEQILAWVEFTGSTSTGSAGPRALRVESGGNISTISSQSPLMLFGATAGHVAFAEGERFFRWDATQGTRTLLLEVVPAQAWVARGVVVFMTGAGKVYRVSLP